MNKLAARQDYQSDLFDSEPPTVASCPDDLTRFISVVWPTIDLTIARLERRTFIVDPILGPRYSRLNSIFSSAQKRHGHILEIALREALRESKDHHVWTEPRFAVSRAADALVNSQSEGECLRSELPYGEMHRVIQIDVGVDGLDFRTGAYELKRANGLHDAGKQRSMRRDLACTRVLLKSYRQAPRGNNPREADARIIFYYGRRSIPAPYSLIREELDDHFRFHIISRIEAANEYYKDRVHALLEKLG